MFLKYSECVGSASQTCFLCFALNFIGSYNFNSIFLERMLLPFGSSCFKSLRSSRITYISGRNKDFVPDNFFSIHRIVNVAMKQSGSILRVLLEFVSKLTDKIKLCKRFLSILS